MNAALLELDQVSRHYQMGSERVRALDGVSFAIDKGEMVAIVGTSGSGKSTLLNILGCLDRPSGGHYRLRGRDVADLSDDERSAVRNGEIGFVFQSFQLLSRAPAWKNVTLPLVYRGVDRAKRKKLAREALDRVSLSHRLEHRPNEMSGGQRQRVAIARALVSDPSLVLADEPTGNLDTATGEQILALFHDLHREGNTIIIVTHEPSVAARCPRAIRMVDGKVVADGPGTDVAHESR
ncbi:MAG TPA: ABC transporter ATP-binding protein [Kofleriaceae bacterium]|nr:ABC transporter ATP-binding protein [Kofleriaceae bacterium]